MNQRYRETFDATIYLIYKAIYIVPVKCVMLKETLTYNARVYNSEKRAHPCQ